MFRNNIYLSVIIIIFHFSACETSKNPATPDEICNNQLDDDGDGDVDCLDTDCAGATICLFAQENCTNGTDDDFDGDVDCEDADCANAAACQPQEDCTNGIDDDGDGNTDCADTDCSQTVGCLEQVCSIYTVFYDSPQVCTGGQICGVGSNYDFLCQDSGTFSMGTFYGACGPFSRCPKGSKCGFRNEDPQNSWCIPLCSDWHPSCPPGGSCTTEEFGTTGLYVCVAD